MVAHAQRHHHADMLSVEEALERILEHFAVLETEEKPILEALGQTLAENVATSFDIPPLDNSAMDGFAVRHGDIRGASPEHPRTLQVIGQVAAGQLPDREVTPGAAVRIMTGAPIPPGADTVVPFEETDEVERKAAGRGLDQITVRDDVGAGANVRPAGEDVARDQLVLEQGTVLRPAHVGVLASLGRTKVRVVRRPVVAILATGDELTEPGEPLSPGKIYDSNSFSVAAGVLRYGGIPHLLGIARDNLEAMHRKLTEALEADMLVTSAGVSRGDYDIVKDVLAERGQVAFWSVRMRPAKPLAFGSLRGPGGRPVPHIGLPGNPVSALVAFEQFCRPALLKMLGRTGFAKPTVQAILRDPIHNTDGRRVYARALVSREDGEFYASLTGPQGSNVLTSMSRANGLAICPEDVPEMKPGQRVQVQMLDWPEEVMV
jgi:molybdopterin molybdotransferase